MAINPSSPMWNDYQTAIANGNTALASQYQAIADNPANTPALYDYRNSLVQNQMLGGGSTTPLTPAQTAQYSGIVDSGKSGMVPNGIDPEGVAFSPIDAGAALASNAYTFNGGTGHIWDQPLSTQMQGLLGATTTKPTEAASVPSSTSNSPTAATQIQSSQSPVVSPPPAPPYVSTTPGSGTAPSAAQPVYSMPVSATGSGAQQTFGGETINVPGANSMGTNVMFGKPEKTPDGMGSGSADYFAGITPGLQPNGQTLAMRGAGEKIANTKDLSLSVSNPAVAAAPQLGAAATAGTASAGPSRDVNAAQAGVSNWNLNPNTTVQGQLNGLLSQGSPLMTIAKTRAEQEMNGKGLLNSSMAVQAGQQAMMDAALPIAQQDANVYAQNGQFNAAAANNNSQFNTAQSNQVGLANQASTNQVNQFNAGQANQVGMNNVDQMNRFGLANLDAATKTALANLTASTQLGVAQTEANYKTNQQLQSSVAALQMSYVTQRGAIMNSTTMNDASKQSALNQLDGYYRSQANLLGVIASGDSGYMMIGV